MVVFIDCRKPNNLAEQLYNFSFFQWESGLLFALLGDTLLLFNGAIWLNSDTVANFSVEIGKLNKHDCIDMSEVSDRSPLQSLSD